MDRKVVFRAAAVGAGLVGILAVQAASSIKLEWSEASRGMIGIEQDYAIIRTNFYEFSFFGFEERTETRFATQAKCPDCPQSLFAIEGKGENLYITFANDSKCAMYPDDSVKEQCSDKDISMAWNAIARGHAELDKYILRHTNYA